MDVKSIRGTHDILPGAVELWHKIEATARRVFALYGFGEVRTPIFEETELFARSIGAETDIVQKEMYSFRAGKTNLTLRPEGTAPVVRSTIEHGLHNTSSAERLYYMGPMFRHEKPQKGRYRQFHQIGIEVLGNSHPAIEAEVLQLARHFLGDLGLDDYRLLVNSVGCGNCRPEYLGKLRRAIDSGLENFCGQCRKRAESNPLRVFDCKVPSCQLHIEALPKISDHLCSVCRRHHQAFTGYLETLGIPFETEPRLVRGLDYYIRTTFELVSDRLGPTQNAVLGGGRYDGLSEALGGPPLEAFGFALGMERLILLLSGRDDLRIPYRAPQPEVALICLGEAAFPEAFKLAAEIRRGDVFAHLDFEGRSTKAQLRQANRLEAGYCCFVGERELETGIFPLKRMADGHQEDVQRDEIAAYIKSNRVAEAE